MPDRNGYIGRAPSDSAVSVARQNYTSSGIATDFTFNSGYVPGYFDLYINGVKMVEGSDYTSSDGSTFSVLNGGTSDGDALEAVAYKAFNAATVTNASDLTVSGDLTVLGSSTFTGAGTSVSFATTAFNLSGTPDINIRNITGVAATFSGKVSYEDVVNIDSVGIVTAGKGVRVTTGGIIVTAGISTFVNATFSKRIDASDNLNVTGFSTFQSKSTFVGIVSCSDVVSSGIVTADYFYGDASNMTNAGISAGKSVALTAFLGC